MRFRCLATFHCSSDARPPLKRLSKAARFGIERGIGWGENGFFPRNRGVLLDLK